MENWTNNFKEIYGDDSWLYIESQAHTMSNGIRFKLCIEVMDVGRATGNMDENYLDIAMYAVPETSQWCNGSLYDIMGRYGYQTRDEAVAKLSSQGAVAAGYAAKLSGYRIYYDASIYTGGFSNVLENRDVLNQVNSLAAMEAVVAGNIEAMLGKRDTIGITGFDYFNKALAGIEPIMGAISRMGMNAVA